VPQDRITIENMISIP